MYFYYFEFISSFQAVTIKTQQKCQGKNVEQSLKNIFEDASSIEGDSRKKRKISGWGYVRLF